MKNLLIGFEGENNSAKLLLDKISSDFNKIYLLNDKSKSVKQVVDILVNLLPAIWCFISKNVKDM